MTIKGNGLSLERIATWALITLLGLVVFVYNKDQNTITVRQDGTTVTVLDHEKRLLKLEANQEKLLQNSEDILKALKDKTLK